MHENVLLMLVVRFSIFLYGIAGSGSSRSSLGSSLLGPSARFNECINESKPLEAALCSPNIAPFGDISESAIRVLHAVAFSLFEGINQFPNL